MFWTTTSVMYSRKAYLGQAGASTNQHASWSNQCTSSARAAHAHCNREHTPLAIEAVDGREDELVHGDRAIIAADGHIVCTRARRTGPDPILALSHSAQTYPILGPPTTATVSRSDGELGAPQHTSGRQRARGVLAKFAAQRRFAVGTSEAYVLAVREVRDTTGVMPERFVASVLMARSVVERERLRPTTIRTEPWHHMSTEQTYQKALTRTPSLLTWSQQPTARRLGVSSRDGFHSRVHTGAERVISNFSAPPLSRNEICVGRPRGTSEVNMCASGS